MTIDREAGIRRVLIDALGVEADALTATATLVEDLGADSLDMVEIGMALEAEFGIEISDQEIEGWTLYTVGDVRSYLDRRLAEARA